MTTNQQENSEQSLLFENTNELLAFVRMEDQYSGVLELLLIEDNESAIKTLIDKYKNSSWGYHEVSFFRFQILKEDFKYLQLLVELKSQTKLYDWMEDHERYLVDTEHL